MSESGLHTSLKVKLISAIIITFFFVSHYNTGYAQQVSTPVKRDTSVVQLYGVVMSSDSLKALGGTTVFINKGDRGTIANDQGIFSIAVEKGDRITFSFVGFKDVTIQIPLNLKSKEYSVIQLLTEDTSYLPATIINSRMTAEQFERYFVSHQPADDAYEIARRNNNAAVRRMMMATLPGDAQESFNASQKLNSVQYYSSGKMPAVNILNPGSWKDFVQEWKSGAYRH